MSGGPVLSHSANQRLTTTTTTTTTPPSKDEDTSTSSSVLVEPCYGLFYAAAPSMPALRAMLASSGNHTDIEPLQLQNNNPNTPTSSSSMSSASTQRFAGYIPSPVILDWCRSMTPK
eukprot:TRINITY_DN27978_c0_g1_i1.p1 TRINITY_DN27978_c0_g1~~TRINITY_DN27978_c0_g1_i1.p1  ORF type:complete len:117 (+),score=29.01 TRINITY_DN27978_c0_g1_i1:202-552(+)